ncbi:MAG TPA: rhodanese-like domain-containing protein, partial [Pyrinomonadaceae bacterium]|nr:rhodanese-like domain-containing protein [Pyrinomonadaceae bacterium]
AEGHIRGAKPIPLSDISKRYTEIMQDRPVFVICRTGRRSLQAQKVLLDLGMTNVRNVRGGIEAWKSEGFEIVKSANAVWSLERQVRFLAGFLVFAGVILALVAHPFFIILPGFVGAGLMFAAVTDTCAMGMLLAKLPWNKTANECCLVDKTINGIATKEKSVNSN